MERQTTREPETTRADFPDYVRALQRIALGQETTATARDQLAALKELLKLGTRGTTSYLERPDEAEITRRSHAGRTRPASPGVANGLCRRLKRRLS
jgi:hypothetical protein